MKIYQKEFFWDPTGHLGPSHAYWGSIKIIVLHKQCPRNLIGILWLAIDPTGPRVSIDHGSQTDGISLGQLDSYDELCIGQTWSLLSLYITHSFHATLNRYLLIKNHTSFWHRVGDNQNRTFNVWHGHGLREWQKSWEYTFFLNMLPLLTYCGWSKMCPL